MPVDPDEGLQALVVTPEEGVFDYRVCLSAECL